MSGLRRNEVVRGLDNRFGHAKIMSFDLLILGGRFRALRDRSKADLKNEDMLMCVESQVCPCCSGRIMGWYDADSL